MRGRWDRHSEIHTKYINTM